MAGIPREDDKRPEPISCRTKAGLPCADANNPTEIVALALMPGWLGLLAAYSPFRSMGAFPVELALGRLPADQVLPGFAMQVVWLGAGLLLFRVLWGAGIKQYSAVGA